MEPRLVCVDGVRRGEMISLESGEVSVGRETDNAFSLADPAVSRHHCTLRLTEAGEIEVEDHGSRNGTFVNGIPVKSRALRQGDQIRIGNSEFLYLPNSKEQSPPPSAVLRKSEILETHVMVRLPQQEAVYLKAGEIPERAVSPGRSSHNLQALLRLSSAIRASEGVEPLARSIMELLFDTVPASEGALLLLEAGFQEPVWSYGWRSGAGPAADVAADADLVSESFADEVGILSAVPSEDLQSGDSEFGFRYVIVTPLAGPEGPIGVIFLASQEPDAVFDEEHLQLTTAVGRVAGLALDDARAIDQLRAENRQLRDEIAIEHDMVGDSPAMRRVYQFIERVAPSNATVLITGESGTGKELVARAIHRNSPRAGRPFVAINAAALTASLLESELFGHERGAFTGAINQKRGKFEVANGGTIFLDEIGELSPDLQAKLLRVLQEREFERVGGTQPIRVDVRVITATNRNLRELVANRKFREDLYYRLDVVSIRVPPLRERREDIPLLANFFVAKFAARMGRKIRGISREARARLANHDWPGNVRELENALERAVVLGLSDTILAEDLPEPILEHGPVAGISAENYHEAVREAKRNILVRAVMKANGNQMQAAATLGIHHTYLSRLIRDLDLRERILREER